MFLRKISEGNKAKPNLRGVDEKKIEKKGVTNVAGIVGTPLSPAFIKKRL